MNKFLFILALLTLFISGDCFAEPLIPLIEVFVSQPLDIHSSDNPNVKIYDIKDADRLLDEINNTIHLASASEAEEIAKHFILSHQQVLMNDYYGEMLANQYNLTAYPAIVFDHGRTIFYGKTNIDNLLQKYQGGFR